MGSETEAVAFEAWKNVEVDVEDVLTCGLAVCEQHVDALASQYGCTEAARCRLCDSEHLRPVLGIELGERGRVSFRDDKHVTRLDRLNVHERDRPVILMHDGHLTGTGHKEAEQALVPAVPHKGMLFGQQVARMPQRAEMSLEAVPNFGIERA